MPTLFGLAPFQILTFDPARLKRAMHQLAAKKRGLGPNGGLLFCMDHLEANAEWLLDQLRPLADAGHYLFFDTPGQAELYSCHEGLARLVLRMQRELDLQLASLHLVDSTLCASPFTFVAASLLSLQAMVRLELPHLNVLTKCDLRQELEGADGAPSESQRGGGGGGGVAARAARADACAGARATANDDT